MFRNRADHRFFRHRSSCSDPDAAATREIGFECSRPGAAAVALWATMQLMPLVKGGEFARNLAAGRSAAMALYDRLDNDGRFVLPTHPALDIVVWAMRSGRASQASDDARHLLVECARHNLHLSLAELPNGVFAGVLAPDRSSVICLRCTLLKPEHGAWVDRIFEIISQAAEAVQSRRARLASRAEHADPMQSGVPPFAPRRAGVRKE
jgi:hypothetical protein